MKDKTHPSTKHLPQVWERKDEWYNFKNINPDVKTLIVIDEKSYEGGKTGISIRWPGIMILKADVFFIPD
ncbi:ThuA domain-containing protein [Niabella sp. W65]|nr:ThuA domain-containing protein [Niabella sp. W65]MCH7368636.1 ThuA domain-containing protein [Niabella sp. W65]